MKFIDEIFVSNKVTDLNTVIYSLKRQIPVFEIYVICTKNDTNNTAFIMPSREVYKDDDESITVVGIAKGKRDAYELFKYIMQYWYDKNETVYTFNRITEEEGIQ